MTIIVIELIEAFAYQIWLVKEHALYPYAPLAFLVTFLPNLTSRFKHFVLFSTAEVAKISFYCSRIGKKNNEDLFFFAHL